MNKTRYFMGKIKYNPVYVVWFIIALLLCSGGIVHEIVYRGTCHSWYALKISIYEEMAEGLDLDKVEPSDSRGSETPNAK